MKKFNPTNQVFILLEKAVSFIPSFIYWKDRNSKFLGANKFALLALGYKTIDEIVGKIDYDIWPADFAKRYIADDSEVMKTGKIVNKEDIYTTLDGKFRYCVVTKAPLYDEHGKIVGIIGSSIDITAEKEAERLRQETERQKIELQEQEKFKQVASQMAHDIRSPLTSLSIIYKTVGEYIPENPRTAALEAMIQLTDIANNLLNYDKDKKNDLEAEVRQPIMVFLVLSQVFSDKKHQNKHLDIKFANSFNPKCTFTAIKAQPTNFKRMMSNLINNAVEALGGKKGIIDLDLDFDPNGNNIKIIVQDSGKGMPQEVIDKILRNVHVATDKKEGHSIGLTQIQETLAHNQGKLLIKSKVGEGTKMILTFPTIEAPNWLAQAIKINKGDTIVVLDDDRSIHGAWDIRFAGHLNEVTVKHFMTGDDTINFINGFSEKEKIFLLTDFELLKQKMDGLNVIEKTNVKRAILVTSHYAEIGVRNRANKIGIKILPKQLATDVPFEICEVDDGCTIFAKPEAVDVVIIDDNESFVNSLELLLKNYNKTTDKYNNPAKFLDAVSQYSTDTKIFIDNDFGATNLNGFELAKLLHNSGFTKLYLLSGTEFKKAEIPEYTIAILKTDIDSLCKIADES